MKSRQINKSDPSDILIHPLKENISGLIDAILSLLTASIWEECRFSDEQITSCSKQIRLHLLNSPDPNKEYIRLCCLILKLHKQDTEGCSCQAIHLFNYSWDVSMVEDATDYETTSKMLAEATLSIHEDNSSENVHYWINWFIERNFDFELELFRKIISNLLK